MLFCYIKMTEIEEVLKMNPAGQALKLRRKYREIAT